MRKRIVMLMIMMDICVPNGHCPCVSCSVVMLFTCTLVRSRPDSNERVKCETRSVGTNSKMLGGLGQTGNTLEKEGQREAQSKPGSRP
jgi:hypothetical protein